MFELPTFGRSQLEVRCYLVNLGNCTVFEAMSKLALESVNSGAALFGPYESGLYDHIATI
jgi:hypothetical protein